MKRVKFSELFLFVSVVIFVVRDRDIYSSALLILASIYMLTEVVPKLWKRWLDAKR